MANYEEVNYDPISEEPGVGYGSGFIKLHRKIMEWGWYKYPGTFHLFVHCILKANWIDKQWEGKTIKRGSFVTSISGLALETGLSEQKVKTCLSKLQSTGAIIKKSTNKFTIITICKYESYQMVEDSCQQTNNKQTTNKQQTNNKQTTTTKEYKEKEEEEGNSISVSSFISFFQEQGYSEEQAKKAFAYYSEKGWKDKRGNKVTEKNWKEKVEKYWLPNETKPVQKEKGLWQN